MQEKQIRILHVVSSLSSGSGVMSVIMNYYRNINREKIQFDFLFFCQMPNTFSKEINELGGNVYFLPKPTLTRFFTIYKIYKWFFQENARKYKAVHLHEVYLNSFIFPLAKKYGVKQLIVHGHSTRYSDKKLNAIRNRILCLFIKKQANIYFACSKAAGEFLYGKRMINSDKFTVLKNAVDVDRFQYNQETRFKIRRETNIDEMFVVGHVGRFVEAKNHDFLLKIFVEIKNIKPNSVLMLVGDGPLLDYIKFQVEKLGIGDSVLFLGMKKNIEEYMQAMDVFVMPSLFEGLPVTGIEAQAAGLPCFLSDTITRELAIANVHFLSLTIKADEWAGEIIKCSNNFVRKDTKNELTNAGFNIKYEAKRLEKLYMQEITFING